MKRADSLKSALFEFKKFDLLLPFPGREGQIKRGWVSNNNARIDCSPWVSQIIEEQCHLTTFLLRNKMHLALNIASRDHIL